MLTKTSRYNKDIVDQAYEYSIDKGIYIDLEVAETLQEKLMQESEDCAYAAIKDLPEEYQGINLNSNKQIVELMTNHFKLEKYAKKTASGGLSFNEDVLTKIVEKTGNTFSKNLMEYRTKRSLASKVKEVLKFIDQDSYVHPQFVYGETNRVSYKEPGLSNLHVDCRPIIAAGPGRKLIKADYSAQEVYIQLNMLGIPELKKVFEENDDFYTGMVKELADFDLTTKPEYRPSIKTAWLAGIYSSGLRGLGKTKEEKALIKLIKEKVHSIPQVEAFRTEIKNKLKTGDMLVESYFGTTREIPNWVRSYQVETIAFNNTFQITGADILFFAIESCIDKLRAEGYTKEDVYIYMTIHDEIIFNADNSLLDNKESRDKLLKTIEEGMILDIEGWNKIKIKLEVSDTY